ncbi:MAG TPA: glucoamylase family protein [Candidatus Limnocylindrales bacterium]
MERLEQHGASLAAAQSITDRPKIGRPIRRRVAENGRVLLGAYRALAEAIKDERSITPAAEWLVDNFHIVEEQLREIRDDLPVHYYRELPKLADGPLEGYPRVLGLVWAYVAHTDSRFDPDSLRRLVAAYQRVEPLTLGELWAIAISLRILLVENLRRLAEQIVAGRVARQQADELADGLLGLGTEESDGPSTALRRLSRLKLPTAGMVQLFQRLRDQDPAVTPALHRLEDLLASEGTTAEETVRLEHQRQASMNVTVRNVITSMRLISWFDWAAFVESVSLIDEALHAYSGFSEMDFATRDRYRHAIEEIARNSGVAELEVARAAVALAKPASAGAGVAEASTAEPAQAPPGGDPGYFLIAGGRPSLEHALGARLPLAVRLRRAYLRSATPGYLGTLALLTALVLAIPLFLSLAGGGGGQALLVAILGLGPASDLAVSLVNRGVAAVLGPRPLPRLEMTDGVPSDLRTLVVVPTLFASEEDVEERVAGLEIHYLANPDGDVRFALLSDWLDAHIETTADDDRLLAAAAAGIQRLNLRHGEAPGGGARFLLFHRKRRWNEGEARWMGWERKRGKLHELNALLRGSTATDILTTAAQETVPPAGVRYVITLDSDTRLPRGAVARLVGTIAHPLNRANFDPASGRVTRGYGILQPRITSTLPAEHEATIFQRAYSGAAGIDPYASAVSDVYQDLFGEGSYTGKGIYDLDAFEAAMAERAPENTLLSHDLFEGIFARAGLVTDIELFDEFPSHYLEACARQHRWARGDWQLLPWILGRAHDARGGQQPSVPAIGRWKMIDNLRRTASAPLAIATLGVAWLAPAADAPTWTGLVVASIVIPALLPVFGGLLPRRQGISRRSHLRAVGGDISLAAVHVGLGLTFLADQAWLMGDAIVRAVARLTVTHRRLLEWTTAAQAKARVGRRAAGFYRPMAGGVGLALAIGIAVLVVRPASAWLAAPFIALWLVAPLIANIVSLPQAKAGGPQLSPANAEALRLIGRRTWRFFETFVGPDDHFLPPDNFQDVPKPVVAHRTSPTNIGMYLLATVTARDLGWIGTCDMVQRIEGTLASIDALQRFRGHLYNWYDTRTLEPLGEPYVSSVDSGNLAGHLLAVSSACREILERPLPIGTALTGIGDAIALVRQAARRDGDEGRSQTLTRRNLDEALEDLALLGDGEPSREIWATRLGELAERTRTIADIAAVLTSERGGDPNTELVVWAEAARSTVDSHLMDVTGPETSTPVQLTAAAPADPPAVGAEADSYLSASLERRLQAVAAHARRLFEEMEFGFLFDPTRKLLSIGFRVTDGVLDPSYYDLLASECRLASFLAIAKGDVGADHWFRLGRALTPIGRGSALISWSGSMFEYLMPALVMRAYPMSLMDQTYRLVVARQKSYGAARGVPWGISESAFNARDLDQIYQYSSFGIPGLGLKRGLSDDLVIAPYATGLAAMIDPEAAVRNFERLGEAGADGPFGFREALDYTPRRLPEGAWVAPVMSYMAHHQGMLLVAIGNVLNGSAMVERFHADPIVRATELLLQERMPRDVLVARPRAEEVKSTADVRDLVPPVLRRFTSPHDAVPRTHLLSNGRYAVMVTAAGSGYSRWGDLAVTRWREDVTRDAWGSYLFLRDRHSGAVWSVGHQPSGTEADSYDVEYAEDHAEFRRRDGPIATRLVIVVSAEHDAEIRRVSVTNLGSQAREVELTSYAEIVLAPQAADVAHPAFQNLFVQTEFAPELNALLATRRPRSASDRQVWAAHVAAVEGELPGVIQYETDRARFLGRGRWVGSAAAVLDGRPLSNTVGAVLDPIFSLRLRIPLAAGATAHAIFSTVVAESREEVLDLADKYRESVTFERAATLAWTQAQVQLHHLGIDQDEALLFQRLANRIIYSDPSLRPSPSLLAQNHRGASGLWAHGISGDLPIVLVRIDEPDDVDIVRQLLRAHEYWRLKLLDVDLVILNEHGPTYADSLQEVLETVVRTSQSGPGQETGQARGRVSILRGDQLSAEDRTMLQAAARAVLLSRRGSLADQVIRLERPERPVASLPPRSGTASAAAPPALNAALRPELEFFNGLGGFADGGREYVTVLGPGQSTPAPWLNVVANPAFGFLVSESGSGYTWSENSRENQLTPWSNDPVSDPVSEAIYVRDDETGELWGPTASPIRLEDSTYVARHGPGYSRFEHTHGGIVLELLQFVPLDDRLKIGILTIANQSGRRRRLSVTAYAEWVLGTSRGTAAPTIVTDLEPTTTALLARNPWNADFADRIAFLDLGGRQEAWTADRTEFLGRNGSYDRPAALDRGHHLTGATGAGMDPCAALSCSFELAAGERTTVRVLLGEADNPGAAGELIRRGRDLDYGATLGTVRAYWDAALGAIKVRTPDRSMDILLNSWLLYQTQACRLWARTAFYQAGGAYGFRDQLQDVLALAISVRGLAREHLLRAAARQFQAGDVQHWWHPPSGRGVRTRISDDRLWLPYVAGRYVAVTGETDVLDEPAPFIEGVVVRAGDEDAYYLPELSGESASLYEHCARAIDASLAVGVHGLPLIGSGDWNDGMNRVGTDGRGESVWLGWFLHTVLAGLTPIAEARGDKTRAERWRSHMKGLRRSLERHGWDGDWYRRAFFDDGTPLGSAINVECRIDSIAQSWAVLSGAANPPHAERAMAAVDEYLVRRGDGLVLLFTPPFDRTEVDPGYVRGYLPGIRENGGQYTHGAIWSVLAFAALGDGDKAGELFSILNPINHASTRAGVHRYKVEPYVMAADVYSEPPHVGRGGWTWYSGSAGWMYQAGIESILGFRLRGATLLIDPCVPRAWPRFEMDFAYHASRYEIQVENPRGVSRGVESAEVDGRVLPGPGAAIPLVDDGGVHRVRVILG